MRRALRAAAKASAAPVLEIHTAEFDPASKRVVTASADRTARVWDAQSGALLAVLQPRFAEVKVARFSPNGQRIVTASEDGVARLWQVRSFDSVARLLEEAKRLEAEAAAAPWATR